MTTPADLIQTALKEGRIALFEHEAKALARSVGIAVPKHELVRPDDEPGMVAAAGRLGYPLAVKAVSAGILHKTEAGAVLLDIKNAAELASAIRQITGNISAHSPGAVVASFLLEKMMPAGPEFLIGGLRDEQFGPAIAFGLGGILAEVLKDAVFGILPLTNDDYTAMMDLTRAGLLLKGPFRGTMPLDRGSVLSVMKAVSTLMIEHPEIREIDLNPVRVYGRGAAALDVRILISA